jgi:hypothetical protein
MNRRPQMTRTTALTSLIITDARFCGVMTTRDVFRIIFHDYLRIR